jgi:hypothetical protein
VTRSRLSEGELVALVRFAMWYRGERPFGEGLSLNLVYLLSWLSRSLRRMGLNSGGIFWTTGDVGSSFLSLIDEP